VSTVIQKGILPWQSRLRGRSHDNRTLKEGTLKEDQALKVSDRAE
jgi:hypothetical protein